MVAHFYGVGPVFYSLSLVKKEVKKSVLFKGTVY